MSPKEKLPHRRKNGRFWLALHGWFALPVWGGLLLICITGTLATVSQEITWLSNPVVRADPAVGVARIDLVEDTVSRAFPDSVIDDLDIGEPYFAYRVRIYDPDKNRRSLMVNPYTGKFQGELTGPGFRGFIIALHGWLLFPWEEDYSVGWYLVTLYSLPLLGSIVTALLITKQFWRHFFRPRLRTRNGSRVFWGDLHRLLGVWSVWFAAIIGVSGLWFFVQGIISHNQVSIYPEAPTIDYVNTAEMNGIEADQALPLSMLVENALVVLPDLQVTYVDLPDHIGDPVIVKGKRRLSLFRESVNVVYLEPYSGEIIATHSPANVSLLHNIVAIMTPLHFGDFGGLTSKLVWSVYGCCLCMIIASGFVIWIKRTVVRTQELHRSIVGGRASAGADKGLLKLKPPTWWGFAFASWSIALLPVIFLLLLVL